MEGPQATQSESETSTLIHSRAVPARLPALVSFQPESLVNFRPVSTLLAEAGLLEGRKATTHWAYCERLVSDYPGVTVEPDRTFLRDGPISSSEGITSGIDLALALVEEEWGREHALAIARMMVVFLKRPGGQSQFSGYLVSEAVGHPSLQKLMTWILEHPAEDLSVEALAARMAMSPRNFARVFHEESGMTPATSSGMARTGLRPSPWQQHLEARNACGGHSSGIWVSARRTIARFGSSSPMKLAPLAT